MKLQVKKINSILVAVCLLILIGGVLWFTFFKKGIKQLEILPHKREPWIVVFIHGNFNTGLGLFSIKPVLGDSIKGSRYSKVTRKLRKDPFFYQEQPILQRGLVAVTPSFDHPIGEFKFAVYPIMSGYQMVSELMAPNKEELHFYTFGWSGLMSQTNRLREALRLYNALDQELKKFKEKNIVPKVRIVAHSHGGNVSLNLASINEALALERMYENPLDVVSEDEGLGVHEKQTLTKTLKLLRALPKETPVLLQGEKRFDYHPMLESLTIEELIVLGTPIQPETSHLIRSRTFKNIYNFYSEGDIIQIMDFISSRKCDQRFDPKIIHENGPHLVEAKVMVDRDIETKGVSPYDSHPWWRKILVDNIIKSKENKDPTHKDLWFLGWNKDFTQPNFPLMPLPVVIIVPFLMTMVNKVVHLRDVDLNLKFKDKLLTIEVFKHNEKELVARENFDSTIIETIKKNVEPWRPDTISRANVFKKIHETLP